MRTLVTRVNRGVSHLVRRALMDAEYRRIRSEYFVHIQKRLKLPDSYGRVTGPPVVESSCRQHYSLASKIFTYIVHGGEFHLCGSDLLKPTDARQLGVAATTFLGEHLEKIVLREDLPDARRRLVNL